MNVPTAILFLQEKGVIQMYYDKWWKSHGRWEEAGDDCNKNRRRGDGKNAVNALGVVNIGGVFVVLLVGLAFAVMVAIAEFCWKTSSLHAKENIVQTSPLRRNSRKFTSIERRRSRKSLCAEIARTLVPRLICDTYGSDSEVDNEQIQAASRRIQRRRQQQREEDDMSELYHYMPTSAATSNVHLEI